MVYELLGQNGDPIVVGRLAWLEAVWPAEVSRVTGRLVCLLAKHPEGLAKAEILTSLYPGHEFASTTRRCAQAVAFDKTVQRARRRYRSFGIGIVWSRATARFSLRPVLPRQ